MTDGPRTTEEVGASAAQPGVLGEPGPVGRHQGRPRSADLVPRRSISSGLALLIVAGISTVVGFVLAAPAVVLAVVSMVNQNGSPSRAARFARWGWIAYTISMGLMLVAGAILIGVATYAASGS